MSINCLDEGVKLPIGGEAQEAEGFSIRSGGILWLGVQVVPGNPLGTLKG